MQLPSDEQFRLELTNLSAFLYDCIGKAGDLAPNYDEWDKYRDRRWAVSRSLLKVFGLTTNREGWTNLIQAFGFEHPTRGEMKRASYRRREEARVLTRRFLDEEYYPELLGTSQKEVVTYVDNGDGTYTKRTVTYTSLR